MNRRKFLKISGSALFVSTFSTTLGCDRLITHAQKTEPPKNIILILADDLGWGDVSCYGKTPGLTPATDKLAAEGIKFVDVHAPASTCTPTRFSILTGEYAWRKPGRGILPGDAGLIISESTTTLPKFMQSAGCVTGAVGKWHLGMGEGAGKTNWNKTVKPGPNEIGFDYSFIMPATGDRVPCVYMENGKVVNLDPNDPIEVNYRKNYEGEPDGKRDRDSLKLNWSHGHNQAIVNGIGRIGYMKGGHAARWNDETMADTLAEKATDFIKANKNKPFFLYFAPHDIHVPRVPHPRFKGKTTMGDRGDAILQFDDQVRKVVETVDQLGLAENTLIVVTSDNGPYLDDGYQDFAIQKLGTHKPTDIFRGSKYTPYEGGHRIPFIVRWKGHAPAGIVSKAVLSLVDLPHSFTALKGIQITDSTVFPDSLNMSQAFTSGIFPGRTQLICQDNRLNIREGKWKYIVPPRAGNNPSLAKNIAKNGELYDIENDPSEKNNIVKNHPEIAEELFVKICKVVTDGRTR